jgi:hypothetical protein
MDFDKAYTDITLSCRDQSERELREEIGRLRDDRSIQFAPVNHPKSFVSDMKATSGRLMDFNKGMFVHLSIMIPNQVPPHSGSYSREA